mmetsp:Transcript_18945/g.28165  ORF Transcript_18945/g.28165 Transcript_18945/m.28165 type:complete len:275 (-) Transcript_18945:1835-2659(-)
MRNFWVMTFILIVAVSLHSSTRFICFLSKSSSSSTFTGSDFDSSTRSKSSSISGLSSTITLSRGSVVHRGVTCMLRSVHFKIRFETVFNLNISSKSSSSSCDTALLIVASVIFFTGEVIHAPNALSSKPSLTILQCFKTSPCSRTQFSEATQTDKICSAAEPKSSGCALTASFSCRTLLRDTLLFFPESPMKLSYSSSNLSAARTSEKSSSSNSGDHSDLSFLFKGSLDLRVAISFICLRTSSSLIFCALVISSIDLASELHFQASISRDNNLY